MNRYTAMFWAVLLLTGCSSQNQSPMHDPFANRTTFPPPPTGEATKDPYYNGVATSPAISSTGAPGISNAAPPSASAPPPSISNNTPTPANNKAAPARGIALQGAQSPADAAGNHAATNNSNGWNASGSPADRFPRPTTDAANVSAGNQNVTTQTLTPRSDSVSTGQMRDISDLPRNL